MKRFEIGVMFGCFGLPFDEGLETTRALGATKIQVGWDWRNDPPETRREWRRRIEAHGVGVSAVCASLDGIHAGDIAAADEGRRSVDLALDLGCRVVTSHIGVIPDRQDAVWDRMAAVAGAIGEYAAAAGVRLAIETGPESPETLASFIDAVCPAGLGANLDPANLVMVGGFDPVKGVYTLGRRVAHTHAKDGVRLSNYTAQQIYGGEVKDPGRCYLEVPLGRGEVDFARWIRALDEVGYDGPLVIEREVGADRVGDIRLAVGHLKACMERE